MTNTHSNRVLGGMLKNMNLRGGERVERVTEEALDKAHSFVAWISALNIGDILVRHDFKHGV